MTVLQRKDMRAAAGPRPGLQRGERLVQTRHRPRVQGLFNFRPAVRPVPLQAHIQGFPGKFYCPRMATMNKPAYAAITTHSPTKPTLIFVSSRRQTRLTALDLLAYAAADSKPAQWLHLPPHELAEAVEAVKDANLKHTLQFGIGLHHAGLSEGDRSVVEQLFCAQKIQVCSARARFACACFANLWLSEGDRSVVEQLFCAQKIQVCSCLCFLCSSLQTQVAWSSSSAPRRSRCGLARACSACACFADPGAPLRREGPGVLCSCLLFLCLLCGSRCSSASTHLPTVPAGAGGDLNTRLGCQHTCPLFVQVLVATSTLAWGVNKPAHCSCRCWWRRQPSPGA